MIVPIDRVIHKHVDMPVDKIIYQDNVIERVTRVEKPVYKEVKVTQFVEEPEYIERIIENPIMVEKIVKTEEVEYVDKIVEYPYQVENTVYKDMPYETIQEVERVHVVKVPKEVLIDRPYYKEVKRTVPVEKVVR